MPLDVSIRSGWGEKRRARVTDAGQLVTAPAEYNLTASQDMVAADTAYNLIAPITGQQIVVDQVILSAAADVSNVAQATIEIYEATSDSTTTVSRSLLVVGMVRFDLIAIPGTNLLVNTGRYVNAKTDDESVKITVLYYYL